ncbi:MAG: S1 RNA-binding domain-containing protein [Chloroflexi bacterium]|nr:S1 RNA-binding domain-containing protein [Chloroflexota bacterium]
MVTKPPSDDGAQMDRLLDEADRTFTSLERGQVVDGVIMKVDKDGLLVNVGQKTEGVVPAREMRSVPMDSWDQFKPGGKIVVTVIRPESEEGHAILSLDRAAGEVGWRKLQEYAESGGAIEGQVIGHNRGGAVVMVEGVQGFIPLSQISSVPRMPAGSTEVPDLSGLVGKKLHLKFIEVNKKRNRAILSERAASQEVRQAKKTRLMDELKEGDIRKGRISGVTSFGAFVDLGGADGLIHISELSWKSVRSPEEVVKVGDEVDVYVIKVDRKAKRIALSLKRTQAEPWAAVASTYTIGQIIPATISKLATFGAFAQLDGSVEGLIHISELSDKMVQHPKDVVREGDKVAVKVVRIEPERRRIGLSIKQVKTTEAEELFAKYKSGEDDRRVERPALSTAMAAQIAEAVASSEGQPQA